jgi:hypothetical protein
MLITARSGTRTTAGLDRSVAAPGPHGLLVVDDMTPEPDWSEGHRAAVERIRQALLSAPGLTSAELAVGSGVILSALPALLAVRLGPC